MITLQAIWMVKLILSHLLTDFVLQPASWVEDRNSKHYGSLKLYLHGLITALLAWLLIGFAYWPIALVILVTHTIIDGWKSYQPKTVTYFLVDQLMHLGILLACWYMSFLHWEDIRIAWSHFSNELRLWKTITAFVFLTFPAGILIGQLTRKWREKISGDSTETQGLADAGKWIGIIERVIIFIFVLLGQFSAIGLLVAAKGIIRFNEKDRQEAKTEYLVIGTLLSITVSVITGLLIKM